MTWHCTTAMSSTLTNFNVIMILTCHWCYLHSQLLWRLKPLQFVLDSGLLQCDSDSVQYDTDWPTAILLWLCTTNMTLIHSNVPLTLTYSDMSLTQSNVSFIPTSSNATFTPTYCKVTETKCNVSLSLIHYNVILPYWYVTLTNCNTTLTQIKCTATLT